MTDFHINSKVQYKEIWKFEAASRTQPFIKQAFMKKQAGQVLTHIIIILWWASCPSEASAKVESFVIIVYNFLYPPARTAIKCF